MSELVRRGWRQRPSPVDSLVDAGQRRVVGDEAPQGLRKQQTVEVDAPVECRVNGDATLLAVLVRILVDNALRYSPARATVRITVQPAEGGVRARVQDSGPGISALDLQRLGERFFRDLGSPTCSR